jgi:hypothetical protein
MDWIKADKKQLLQIALSEDCPIEFKYRAVLELQERKKKKDYLPQIVYLFGMGLLVPDIAKALFLSHQKVEKIINQKELWRTRYYKEKGRCQN